MGHIMSPSTLPLADRYFIGGPLSLRGFLHRGIGHSSAAVANASDTSHVGGSCFWMAALHAYAPLPFLGRPSLSVNSLGDDDDDENSTPSSNPIQLHAFATAGDLSSNVKSLAGSLLPSKDSTVRLSVGGGVVMRLGSIARLEINYAVPLKMNASDSHRQGFQFGVGMHFV